MDTTPIRLIASLVLCGQVVMAADNSWKPANGPLMTRWAKDVSPKTAHSEYPQPQMVRKEWLNLNGLWDYAIVAKDTPQPEKFEGKILVPFPVESALSGVMKRVYETNQLWYRRTFEVPKQWGGKRVLLHFGAVDWEATVWVNGKKLGSHRGGYDGFSFDITEALKPSGEQEIVASVFDPTDAGTQPRGKQVRSPKGIWYTPTTGIWQTVWLEPVDQAHIIALNITPDVDKSAVTVWPTVTSADPGAQVEMVIRDGRKSIYTASATAGGVITMPVKDAKLWTPDAPHLYDLTVTIKRNGKTVDAVNSYFGMRKISLGKDKRGHLRVCLNNQPLFQFGPLDQGFWPDGLYTAPTDEALRYDIEMTKKLGFNMARKHVKVEPDRWYYWCDKLGLLVWQDMPSGDKSIRREQPDIQRSPESGQEYETELKALVEGRFNHPSIVMWVPYNEGWGQWDTCRIVDLIRKWDPTRLVDDTSGWTDRGCGDVNDMHKYPGPGSPDPEKNRAVVLGEFGGLGLPVRGHTWQDEKNWGYRSFADADALAGAYVGLMRNLFPLVESHGLSAAVYTQTSDVEIEVNGLMTYDRAVVKMNPKKIAAANHGQFPPAPTTSEVVPTAQREQVAWRYTFSEPAGAWFKPEFDASAWKLGQAGFGTRGTPGAIVRTEWRSRDIWLRREFNLPLKDRAKLRLLVHHDEDAEVYLNGVPAVKVAGFTKEYEDLAISAEARASLRPVGNVLAVHCHQTTGGQYIDAGLAIVVAK